MFHEWVNPVRRMVRRMWPSTSFLRRICYSTSCTSSLKGGLGLHRQGLPLQNFDLHVSLPTASRSCRTIPRTAWAPSSRTRCSRCGGLGVRLQTRTRCAVFRPRRKQPTGGGGRDQKGSRTDHSKSKVITCNSYWMR